MSGSGGSMKEIAWITWEIQQRNRSMSAAVGAELFEFDSRLPRIIKYPVFSIKTIFLIFRYRWKTVFLQNPSLVLCLIGISIKDILKRIIELKN